MSNKNEVFEYLIDQLRQQLPVVDVMGEIERWSIDRSIAGRGNYTDEENAIIDAYIGLGHNPYKQQCEDLAHGVQSLKNQLRDMSELVDKLLGTITLINGKSSCRKEDTHECYHNWRFVNGKAPEVCINCGVTKAEECKHDWYFYDKGASMMCKKCGFKK